MKGSSLATVVLIAIVSTIVAAFVVNSLLGDPDKESVTISYMDVMPGSVLEPDPEVFNNWAVNPTVEVIVGKCEFDEIWSEEKQACLKDDDSNTDEDEETGTDEAED